MGAIRWRLAVVIALGVLTITLLASAGASRLASPPVGSWSALEGWYEQVGPSAASLAGLRVAAMLGTTWLVVGAGLQLVATLSLGGRLAGWPMRRALE